MKRYAYLSLLVMTSLLYHLSCEQEQQPREQPVQIPPTISYSGQLSSVNPQMSQDSIRGTVDITIVGDSLTFTVSATGLPPDILHLLLIHGFKDGSDALCADGAQDVNNDGIVDILESGPVSGITLIPLHDNPTSLNLISDSFPTADSTGSLYYRRTISRKALEKEMLDAYGVYDLELDRRVLYIHSIPDTANLPNSVQSMENVEPQLTVPIACAKLTVP